MAIESQVTRLSGPGCPGYAGSIAVRLIMNTLGPNTVVESSCVCAGAVTMRVKTPGICLMFPNAGSVASGVSNALKMMGKSDINIVAFAGDGGTADIGLQALSGAAERNDNVLYVCLDNEAYMNTGVQKSGATPQGARTTTTPEGKLTRKKNMPLIMAYHYIPYVATASVGFPHDLTRKVKEAAGIKGFRYLHVLLPCPPGWGYSPELTVEISKMSVNSRFWPLYKIHNGKLTITHGSSKVIPIAEYLKVQKRFRGIPSEIVESLQRDVDRDWKWLEREAAAE